MPLSETTWRVLLTFFLVLATLMQALDNTIANVALPHMQGSLNASQDQISWVVTSYIVGAAISMALTGFLAERYGRKRMLVVATIGFTIMSVLCSASQTIGQIVMFRAMQGFCSAWIIPLTQAVLMEAYPRDRQAQAISWWGMGTTVGPMVGPTLGGYITDHLSWRWVFLINLPIGVITVAGLLWLARETERKPRNYFDMLGYGLLACAIAALQLMLDRGQTLDWFGSTEVVAEAIIAVAGLYLFTVHVLTTPRPFMDLKIYRDRNYLVGLVLVFFASAIPMSTMVLMPLLMQNVMGYPVITVGVLMAPRGVGAMLSTWSAVHAMRLIGPRITVLGGLILSIVTMALMLTFTTDTGEAMLMLSGLLQGLGMGFVFTPMNVLMLTTIDRRYLTELASFTNLVRMIGSSVGISIFVTLVSQNMQVVRSGLAEHINAFSRPLQQMAGQVSAANPQVALAMINGEIDRQAAMTAYIDDFKLLMIMSFVLMPLILMFRGVSGRPAADAPAAVVEA